MELQAYFSVRVTDQLHSRRQSSFFSFQNRNIFFPLEWTQNLQLSSHRTSDAKTNLATKTSYNFLIVRIRLQRQDQKRSDLDEQLKEYINEWRKQRSKEEDELKRLKEKQAKRKVHHN